MTTEWRHFPKSRCPVCDRKGGVWQDKGPGDYYYGPTCICTSCESAFHEVQNVRTIKAADHLWETLRELTHRGDETDREGE